MGNVDLGQPWARVVSQIAGLLAAPYVGPRRFRAVRTDEPGEQSDAA
jgi:hypothetical protein